MSLGRSVFYKERDWNDFHFYNGSILQEIKIVETPINYDYRYEVSTKYHSTYIDRILPSEERLHGLKFLQDRVYNLEFSVLKGFYVYENCYNLLSCLHGKLFVVVVDDREFSTTRNKWESFVITPNNSLQILIPPYMSYAFYSFEKNTILFNKMAYSEEVEIKKQKYQIFKHRELNINWPTPSAIQ
jgi:dTDP-4-dehydrorhamnose 3,5-epimerase-like enzyme